MTGSSWCTASLPEETLNRGAYYHAAGEAVVTTGLA